jgi:hypothetical protein
MAKARLIVVGSGGHGQAVQQPQQSTWQEPMSMGG